MLPGVDTDPGGAERRRHRRVASTELPEAARIRIPDRPPVSLVDLSPGGALLELPFQLQPETRVTLELSTSAEHLAVPFRLIRCYVADLDRGVRYHAAGEFDRTLRLSAALNRWLTPSAAERLAETLEGLQRASQGSDVNSRGIGFNGLVAWALTLARRGETAEAISLEIRSHLAQLFPWVAITPSTPAPILDASTAARFFGFDFRSSRTLTASDRRFFRASAQLIMMVDKETQPQQAMAGRIGPPVVPSPVVHSLAEWQTVSKPPQEALFSRRSRVA